jgi:hypothetical protein
MPEQHDLWLYNDTLLRDDMIWCSKEEGFYLIWKLQDVLQGTANMIMAVVKYEPG